MRNTAYSFVRLECGILADISPLSPTFKYTLPVKIKDLLLEYHTNQFPLILNYSHSSKYRVDFYKIQNPYRNWCDITCNIHMGSRQIQKCARKVSSYNMGKKQFKRHRYRYFFYKIGKEFWHPHFNHITNLSLSMCISFSSQEKKIAAEE